MANATDRLNQLQQYMNYYRNGGDGSNPFSGHFGRPGDAGYAGSMGSAAAGGVNMSNVNPYEANNASLDWAQAQMDKQQNQQNMEDQNSMFKGMYAGNGQSQFGAPPAYVQPQNQEQQPNPYSARAMQLNGGGQNGGQNGGNTLADIFRNYNKGG